MHRELREDLHLFSHPRTSHTHTRGTLPPPLKNKPQTSQNLRGSAVAVDGLIRGVDVFGPLRCLGLIKLSLTPTTTPLGKRGD